MKHLSLKNSCIGKLLTAHDDKSLSEWSIAQKEKEDSHYLFHELMDFDPKT
jgi:hypothetical protein